MATTLKLPPQLKDRVASVIEGTGKSAHAFMVEAIEEQTALAERRKGFVAAAVSARRDFRRTRKGYALEDVRRYFAARVTGKRARKPRLKRWRE
jgi:predicted transcriptional regulator